MSERILGIRDAPDDLFHATKKPCSIETRVHLELLSAHDQISSWTLERGHGQLNDRSIL